MLTTSRPLTPVTPRGIDRTGVACCVIIALVIVAAYLPSLNHAPRGDQWSYLMDMLRQESCGDLILNSYSYNRTRVIKPGDTVLFRPLLFAHLSVMACVSGTRIWFPQAFGIALHIGVAWLLFAVVRRLLIEITANARMTTVFAVLVALYFSTTPAIMEQVIWAHVNAYMLAALCVLGVIFIQVRVAANGELVLQETIDAVAVHHQHHDVDGSDPNLQAKTATTQSYHGGRSPGSFAFVPAATDHTLSVTSSENKATFFH